MSSVWVCPFCAAHDMSGDCWHAPEQWLLMHALATHVQDGGEVTDNHIIGWEDDADGLLSDVGPAPYVITNPGEPVAPYFFAVIINGVLCAAQGGGDCDGPLDAIVRVAPAGSGEQQ